MIGQPLDQAHCAHPGCGVGMMIGDTAYRCRDCFRFFRALHILTRLYHSPSAEDDAALEACWRQ